MLNHAFLLFLNKKIVPKKNIMINFNGMLQISFNPELQTQDSMEKK